MIKKNSIQVRYPKISIVDVIQLSQFPSMILEASITSSPYKENRVEFHNLHNTIYANPIKVHRLFCKVISVRKNHRTANFYSKDISSKLQKPGLYYLSNIPLLSLGRHISWRESQRKFCSIYSSPFRYRTPFTNPN